MKSGHRSLAPGPTEEGQPAAVSSERWQGRERRLLLGLGRPSAFGNDRSGRATGRLEEVKAESESQRRHQMELLFLLPELRLNSTPRMSLLAAFEGWVEGTKNTQGGAVLGRRGSVPELPEAPLFLTSTLALPRSEEGLCTVGRVGGGRAAPLGPAGHSSRSGPGACVSSALEGGMPPPVPLASGKMATEKQLVTGVFTPGFL